MPVDAAASAPSFRRWDTELFLVGGSDREDLRRQAAMLRDRLGRGRDLELRDVAYTMNCAGPLGPSRLSIVAESIDDLVAKLGDAEKKLAEGSCVRIRQIKGVYYFAAPLLPVSRLGFVFPGEGSQYVGMLGDLAMHFPEVRAWLDLMDRALWHKTTGRLPSNVIFPRTNRPAAWGMDEASESVFAATQGLLALLRRLGVAPDALVGHSTGEYSALLAAGAIELADCSEFMDHTLELNRIYGKLAAEGRIPEGSMLAVGSCPRRLVLEVIERQQPDVLVAMDNCPNQVVLFGTAAAVAQAAAWLRARKAICDPLPFNRAYHTPLFEAFRERALDFLRGLTFAAPKLPLYSCTTADLYPADPDAMRELAAAHWIHPVRFRETVERMHADGVRVFVEVGPRGNLTSFVDDILKGRPHEAAAANAPHRSGTTQLHHLLAVLAAHGLDIQCEPLYERRGARKVDFLSASGSRAAARGEVSLSLNLPRLVLPADMVPRAVPAPASVASPSAPARNAVLEEYFRTMNVMLDVQRQMMTAYLAGRGAVQATPAMPVLQAAVSAVPVAAPSRSEPQEQRPAMEATSVRALVLEAVADRTGYPVEMLDPKLDLESDLGIDSIKRIEIAGALQRRLGASAGGGVERASRSKTLRQLIDCFSPAEPPATRYPFLRDIVLHDPGKRLVATCALTCAGDAFLLDHTLGRGVSARDPELTGLPLVPIAITLEIIAEAGVYLTEGRRTVTALRDMSACRWIAVPDGSVALRIQAERTAEGEARIEIFADGRACAHAIVELGDKYAPPPSIDLAPLAGPGVPPRSRDRMYAEAMFTGPRFQGVASIQASGADGMSATLRTPETAALLDDPPASARLVLNPVLLDAAGQLVGFWTAERFERDFVVFPYGLERLDIYSEAYATATELRCEARISLEQQTLSSTLAFVDGSGRLVARISKWRDRRFSVPSRIARFVLDPVKAYATEPFTSSDAIFPEGVAASTIDPAVDAWVEDEMWLLAISRVILSRREREAYAALGQSNGRRREWLLGRLAAKDCVRRLLSADGACAAPADIEIATDAQGAPYIAGDGASRISITHAGGRVLAVAAKSGDVLAIGVDATPVRETDADFRNAAFDGDELAMLGGGAVSDE